MHKEALKSFWEKHILPNPDPRFREFMLAAAQGRVGHFNPHHKPAIIEFYAKDGCRLRILWGDFEKSYVVTGSLEEKEPVKVVDEGFFQRV